MSRLRFELCVLGDVQHNFIQQHRRRRHALFSIFEPGQGEQAPNQLVEAAGFELNALEHARALRSGALPRQPKSHVQTRQRRAQLMRNVVQQTRLGLHQSLQTASHSIEIAHQSRDLIVPAALGISGARREVPGSEDLSEPDQLL